MDLGQTDGRATVTDTCCTARTCEHVGDEVGLDVGSSVVAEQRGREQRRDAAEWQEEREAGAAEQREVDSDAHLQRFRQLHAPQHERVQAYIIGAQRRHINSQYLHETFSDWLRLRGIMPFL